MGVVTKKQMALAWSQSYSSHFQDLNSFESGFKVFVKVISSSLEVGTQIYIKFCSQY